MSILRRLTFGPFWSVEALQPLLGKVCLIIFVGGGLLWAEGKLNTPPWSVGATFFALIAVWLFVFVRAIINRIEDIREAEASGRYIP